MSLLFTALRQAGQLIVRPSAALNSVVGVAKKQLTAPRSSAIVAVTRASSSQQGKGNGKREKVPYDAYEDYSHYNQSPYRPYVPQRFGYETKYYTGGPLPRIAGCEKPLPMPEHKVSDNWSSQKALFGQNDYIDILGDGTIHPKELIKGPPWLRGFRGNEMQRLIRRLGFEGGHLLEDRPTEYNNIKKRMFYLYKRYNQKRSHKKWWSRHGRPRQGLVRDPYTY